MKTKKRRRSSRSQSLYDSFPRAVPYRIGRRAPFLALPFLALNPYLFLFLPPRFPFSRFESRTTNNCTAPCGALWQQFSSSNVATFFLFAKEDCCEDNTKNFADPRRFFFFCLRQPLKALGIVSELQAATRKRFPRHDRIHCQPRLSSDSRLLLVLHRHTLSTFVSQTNSIRFSTPPIVFPSATAPALFHPFLDHRKPRTTLTTPSHAISPTARAAPQFIVFLFHSLLLPTLPRCLLPFWGRLGRARV